MDDNSREEAERLKQHTIRSIWGYATGMMALCIPLSAATHSGPILPILTIIGAVAGTAVMNRRGDKAPAQPSGLARLEAQHQQQIAELEERLANVETIGRFGSYLEEKAMRQTPLEQEALAPQAPSARSMRPPARPTEVA